MALGLRSHVFLYTSTGHQLMFTLALRSPHFLASRRPGPQTAWLTAPCSTSVFVTR